MDSYQFGYRWRVEGPIETVFHFVSDARTFHEWFPVFKRVEPEDWTSPLRVGMRVRCRVKALLPYTLDWQITVARLEPPRLLETDCRLTLNGRFAMHGYVRYRLEQDGGLVTVINEQELTPERPLPRVLHPLAQVLFSLNHDWAMGQAQAPLQRAVRRAASLA
jgi:hypothetical protein